MENVIHTAPYAAVPALYKAAAVSVIALSIAGIGVMTGYLPVKKAEALQPVAALVAPAPAVALAAPVPASTTPAAPPAAPVVERAAKPRIAKPAPRRIEEPTAAASPVSTHPVAVSSSGSGPVPYPAYPSYPQTQGDVSSYPKVAQAPVPARQICTSCGTIESIRAVEKPGEASGVGIAGGALGGGVLGRQFGNGRGRDVLTVLGAIGGGIAGNQIEKSVRSSKTYEVTIRMEDGSMRTISSPTQPNWRSGERVRVDGNNISVDYS